MNESMTSSQRHTFDFKGFRESFKQPEEKEKEAKEDDLENEVPTPTKGRKQ